MGIQTFLTENARALLGLIFICAIAYFVLLYLSANAKDRE